MVGIVGEASPILPALLGLSGEAASDLRAAVEAAHVPMIMGHGLPRSDVPEPIRQAAADGSERHLLLPLGVGDMAVGLFVFASEGTAWPDLMRVQQARGDLELVARVAALQRNVESAAANRADSERDIRALLSLWTAEGSAAVLRRLAEVAATMADARVAAAGPIQAGALQYQHAYVDGVHQSVSIRYGSGPDLRGSLLQTGDPQAQPADRPPILLALPVRALDGRLIAAFEVRARPGRVFGASVRGRLGTLAEAAGPALDAATRLEEARAQGAEWTALLPDLRMLARAATPSAIHAALARVARDHFGAAGAALTSGDVPLCTVPGSVISEVDDLDAESLTIEDRATSTLGLVNVGERLGWRRMLTLRVVADGQTAALACLGWTEAGAVDPALRRRLEALGGDLASAVTRLSDPQTGLPGGPTSASRLEVLGTIASGVAHGLNNALGGILGHAELATTRRSLEEVRGDISWIRTAAEQAAETIRRIQVATGVSRPTELRELDANVAVLSSIGLAQQAWEQRGEPAYDIVIETDLRATEPVHGNAEQLEEALVNLLNNAAEAMDGSGAISVATWSTDGRTFVQIRDEGEGVPPEIHETLFDPFVSTKPGAGRGLGLAIAAGIVHVHGGVISVESREAAGTQVTIELPSAAGESAAGDLSAPDERMVGLRILLVEDDEVVRTATEQMLTREGHSVVAVEDAGAALEAFAPDRFDLVITDLGLPSGTGWDLIQRLHASDPDVPSLVMTGYGERPDSVRQAELGVRVVLPKPFQSSDLRNAVESALRGPESGPAE